MPATANEVAILKRCLKGDSKAFEIIVAKYQQLVCAITYSGIADVQRSEELAHKTFINAWNKLSQLRDLSKFRPWLCAIARNHVKSFIKDKKRDIIAKAKPMENINDKAADDSGPLESAIKKEHIELVDEAISQIPQQYSEPLVLYYRRYQSVKQVAQLLDLSEEIVKKRLQRGRKMIKEQLSSIVEKTLPATGPKKVFTTVVMASVAGIAIKSSGVAATVGTAASGVTIMSGITAKIITAAAVLAIGVGAVVTYRQIAKPEPGPGSLKVVSTQQKQTEEKDEFAEEAPEHKQRDETNISSARTTNEIPQLQPENIQTKPTEDNQATSQVLHKEMGTYFGVVTNAAGEPIEGVVVNRYWYSHNLPDGWTDDPEAITNAMGQFELGPLPVIEKERYLYNTILFEHPDYAVAWFTMRRNHKTSIGLVEPSFITGWVVDEEGNAVEGATVIAILPLYYYDRNQANGYFEISKVNNSTVTTNTDGQFVFDNLPLGSRLHLTVLKKGYEKYDTTEIYDRFKYPIRTGHQDILVTLKPGGAIKGQLVLDGKPYQKSNIFVKAHTTGGRLKGCALTDDKGKFEMLGLIAKRSYTLIIDNRFFESTGLICKPTENIKVGIGQEPAVELELHKGIPVTIEIKDKKTGEIVSNTYVKISLFDPNYRETEKPVNFSVADARTNNDGQCSFKLMPNFYRLYVWEWKDTIKQDFRITDNQTEFKLTVGITTQPKIYGFLFNSDGEPVPGRVQFASRYTRTNASGEFVVDEPSGKTDEVYLCYAFDTDETLGHGFFWRKSDDANDLEIILEPFATITGRIVDKNGEGVASVKPELSLVPPDGYKGRVRPNDFNTDVKEDGSFVIKGIPTGVDFTINFASNSLCIIEAGKWRNGNIITIKIEQLQPAEIRDVGDVFVKREKILNADNIKWDGSLSGIITNENGEAVVGFYVGIHFGRNQFSETTDINGRYEFVGLPGNRKVRLIVSGRDDTKFYNESFEPVCNGNDFDIQIMPK